MAQQVYKHELPRKFEKVEEKVRPEQDLGHTALGDEIKKDLDDLLDEIDELVAQNALIDPAEFIQESGE